MTGFRWYHGRDVFLGDAQFRAAEDLTQFDGHPDLAGKIGILEAVGMDDALVGNQFEIGATERVAAAGGEIGETHPVGAAHLRIEMMDLPRESIRRQPLDLGVGIKEGAVDPVGRRAQHAVEADGVVGWRGHGWICFTIMTNGTGPARLPISNLHGDARFPLPCNAPPPRRRTMLTLRRRVRD